MNLYARSYADDDGDTLIVVFEFGKLQRPLALLNVFEAEALIRELKHETAHAEKMADQLSPSTPRL